MEKVMVQLFRKRPLNYDRLFFPPFSKNFFVGGWGGEGIWVGIAAKKNWPLFTEI